MKSIGILGTAKNTGKTTTTLYLLRQIEQQGEQAGITSIGLDGEEHDFVTRLPKPRMELPCGTLVLTAERCLEQNEAKVEILERTGLRTSLGELLLLRVKESGRILVAGPHRKQLLEKALNYFSRWGTDVLLVDGALNRAVPMTVLDGVILTTGAALVPDVEGIVRHTSAIIDLFQLPMEEEFTAASTQPQVVFGDGEKAVLNLRSLLSEEYLPDFVAQINKPVRAITLPVVCAPKLVEKFLKLGGAHFTRSRLIFSDPFRMLAGGNPIEWDAVIQFHRQRGGQVRCFMQKPLHCITVNPFFPRYDPQTATYKADRLDAVKLFSALRKVEMPLPVFDLYVEKNVDLWKICQGGEINES